MDYTLTSKVYADISDCALEDLKILPQQQNFNYQIGLGELYYTVPQLSQYPDCGHNITASYSIASIESTLEDEVIASIMDFDVNEETGTASLSIQTNDESLDG